MSSERPRNKLKTKKQEADEKQVKAQYAEWRRKRLEDMKMRMRMEETSDNDRLSLSSKNDNHSQFGSTHPAPSQAFKSRKRVHRGRLSSDQANPLSSETLDGLLGWGKADDVPVPSDFGSALPYPPDRAIQPLPPLCFAPTPRASQLLLFLA